MSKTLRNSLIISTAGLGFGVGALGPVAEVPLLVLFGAGLGLMLGGVYRFLRRLEARLGKLEASGKTGT